GIRDLRTTASRLQVSEPEAALAIETAAAAGLLAVGSTEETDRAWLPTRDYDAWLAAAPQTRWCRLATAWLDSSRRIGRITGRGAKKPVNALADGMEREWLPTLRREVLGELVVAQPGEALNGESGQAALLQRLRWRRPRRPRA